MRHHPKKRLWKIKPDEKQCIYIYIYSIKKWCSPCRPIILEFSIWRRHDMMLYISRGPHTKFVSKDAYYLAEVFICGCIFFFFYFQFFTLLGCVLVRVLVRIPVPVPVRPSCVFFCMVLVSTPSHSHLHPFHTPAPPHRTHSSIHPIASWRGDAPEETWEEVLGIASWPAL